jgi:hypothetical protein
MRSLGLSGGGVGLRGSGPQGSSMGTSTEFTACERGLFGVGCFETAGGSGASQTGLAVALLSGWGGVGLVEGAAPQPLRLEVVEEPRRLERGDAAGTRLASTSRGLKRALPRRLAFTISAGRGGSGGGSAFSQGRLGARSAIHVGRV